MGLGAPFDIAYIETPKKEQYYEMFINQSPTIQQILAME